MRRHTRPINEPVYDEGCQKRLAPFSSDFENNIMGKKIFGIIGLVFLLAYCVYAWRLIRHSPPLRRKYRTGLIVAFVAPLLVGSIFKYFLLVPMPAEGLVVALLDAIWYFEF